MKKSIFRVTRFFLSGFCVLAMHSLLQAQDLSLTFGKPMEKNPAAGSIFFNTTLKKGYNVVNGKTLTVTPINDYIQYNTTSIPVKSEILADSRKTFLEGFHTIGDKNYVIYSVSDKDRNELVVYSQELSADMLLLGAPLRIAKFDNSKTNTGVLVVGTGWLHNTGILIRKSRSGKKMVIVRQKEEGLDMTAFSPDKGALWSKSFPLDAEFSYKLSSAVVTESGNVYVAGNYMKRENYRNPFLLAYSAEKATHKLHVIPTVKKMEDAGYAVRLATDETPLWVGLYYDINTEKCGYRMHTVDPGTLELRKMAEKQFTDEYTDMVHRGAYQLEHFSVGDLFQLGSGDIVFSIDGGMVQAGQHMSTGYGVLAYVVRTDKQGNEKWNATIQKYQVQPLGSSFIGHHLFYKDDKVYMIYNDNPENISPSATEEQKGTLLKNKIYVAVVEFDNTGKSKRTGLISQDKKQYSSFDVSDVRRVDDNLYQFLFKVGDEYKFALLQANK